MITVAYDARALAPVARHWGIGTVLMHVVGSLSAQFRMLGIADGYEPPAGMEMRMWPRVRHTGRTIFEFSAWLARHDVYWGTEDYLPMTARGPSVLTIYDLLPINGLEDRDRLRAWRFGSSVRRAHCIRVPSAATADDLLSHFPEVAKKIEVIHLGVDPVNLPGSPAGDPAAEPYVLMLGSHGKRKNPQLGVAAVGRARESGLTLGLLVTGNIHPSLRDFFDGVPPWIRPIGVQPRERLTSLLAGAVALAFTSPYEGFGLPILEAMAAGCPVLALDTPSNREVGGSAALLSNDITQWAGWLRELAGNGAFREEVRARGRENVKRFPWQRTVDGYAQAFQSVAR